MSERARAAELFAERFDAHVRSTDRLFAYLLLGQWLFGIFVAVTLSPYAWQGKTHVIHGHLQIALGLGGLVTLFPCFLAFYRPGTMMTRTVIVIGQMLWSSLLIHLTGGRIETHFHVFGSLAFISFYRDWRLYIPATLVVAGDHVVRQFFWPESVYGILAPESWRFLEHAGWVIFEDVFLILACVRSAAEMKSSAVHQAHELAQLRAHEMKIAASVQTSLLPHNLEVAGLEIAAKMVPAVDVGGDYYEVIPVNGGCWIGIGDVAGHGLQAGLVMFQAQSAIAALVASKPNAAPRELLCEVNRVLFEHVRKRLRSDEHMTMSLIRYYEDGRIISAGGHEEALILRAGTHSCERIPVKGAWLGVVADIGRVTFDEAGQLGPGDVLVLYTDGVIEGKSSSGERFGIDRLCAAVEKAGREAVSNIRDDVFAAVEEWTNGRQEDDVTVMVLRQQSVSREGAVLLS